MLKHYLKITIRNILRNKVYSFINIIGLSIGLAGSFFILLYVLGETGYDRYHKKRNRIFRVLSEYTDWEATTPETSLKLAPALADNFPEIEKIARIYRFKHTSVKSGNEFIEEKNFQCADAEIFDIFTLPFLIGDPESALEDPFSVVLTEKMSSKYFANRNPMGEILTVLCREELINLTITGILKDIPKKSTFKADFITPIFQAREELRRYFEKGGFSAPEGWGDAWYTIYLTLLNENQAFDLKKKFPEFEKKNLPEYLQLQFDLQPLKDIYFHSSDYINNVTPQGNIKNVLLFSIIGFLILFVAGINFIILTTAKSILRSKEIGIRKVVGANINSIIKQVLTESILYSCFALLTAITLVHIFLPFINQLFNRELAVNYVENWQFTLGILLITLSIAVISGTYVVFFLSRYQPIDVFRSKLNTGITRLYFQRFLITVQLIIFCTLIICSGIIYRQIYFAQNLEMGFNNENLVIIYGLNNELNKKFNVFANEINKHPSIVNISAISSPGLPTEMQEWYPVFIKHDPSKKVLVDNLWVHYNFIETLEIQMLEGRTFSREFSDDMYDHILINETGIRALEIDDPIGYEIDTGEGEIATVVGVFKDFHAETVHEKIQPLIIELYPEYVDECIIRIIPDNIPEIISFLKNKWEEFAPDIPFNYKFMNDIIEELYGKERKFGQIITVFTLLTILIASLGLFGLTLFITEQKKQEIGIRKTFGASVITMIIFITKDFLILVLIGNMIAWPVAWYLMDRWLQNFAYRTPFEAWIFIITGILSLIIVFLTMSLQTFKAASTNPVEVLKYE